jgi:hypothetical protein
MKKKREAISYGSCNNQFTVVLKFKDKASYKNMVDLLDEMSIVNVSRYGIQDLEENDIKLIDAYKGVAAKK